MRKFFLIALLIIGFKGVSQDTTYYDSDWEETEEEKAEYYRVINELDSLWSIKDYYMDNKLQMTGTLNKPNHLARHGDFKWYYKGGGLKQTGQYSNGEKNGKLEFYFKNGELESIENYKNGVPHGPFCSYYSNGQISSKGKYLDGKLDGVIEFWYKNGQMKSHSNYHKGKKIGKWIYYDKEGNITNEFLFQTKYEIIEDKLIFEIPNGEWMRNKLQKNKNIEWHSFKRKGIKNDDGIMIYPNISFLIEEVGDVNDVIIYSMQKRQKMPFNVDSVFTYEKTDLNLKNAVGYLGNTTYQNGTKHTVLIVHALLDNKGVQIVMDMTSDLFDEYGDEFWKALSGISRDE